MLDLFGQDIVIPTNLEPDSEVDGLLSIGASINSVSPAGVERYEEAAYKIAEQVITLPTVLDSIFPVIPLRTKNPAHEILSRHLVPRSGGDHL